MKYNEGELVVIGTLQETNNAENLVDLSVQISRETDRSFLKRAKKVKEIFLRNFLIKE